MIPAATTPLEQEIDANWKEYPEGNERFLVACKSGTIKGNESVAENNLGCGCAYGHISGLNDETAWEIIYARRQYFRSTPSGFTHLENAVYPIQPGDDLSYPLVREIHDLILARKPV